jgi:hypothetical protein
LARLNKGDNQLIRQAQTVKALAQAKAALIGFAATYADDPDHKGQPQGYLPCPDFNGDGSSPYSMSSDTSCGEQGKSMIGRLPWRTLGLPPLRDGHGECLWYAVSGSYKDRPKQALTSDEDGLLIVKDANGSIIAGTTATDRAIAIVFSAGAALTAQNRGHTGVITECGADTMTDDANNPLNYLDNLAGIANNATGSGLLNYKIAASSSIFTTTDATDIPIFVSAPETKDANGQVIFNDVLSIITPKDFEPVYRRMNEWVAERVTQCIVNYATENKNNFFSKYATPIGTSESPAVGTYRKAQETYIENFVDISTKRCKALDCDQTCKNYCGDVEDLCKSDCADTTCEVACEAATVTCNSNCEANKPTCEVQCNAKKVGFRKNALDSNATRYPWATTNVQDETDPDFFKGETGQRFGRIPLTPSTNYDSTNSDPDLPATWAGIGYSKTSPDNKQCFAQPSNTSNYEWWWWKSWKYLVFYAIGATYAPQESTYLWIKTARDISQDATGKWVEENWGNTATATVTATGYVARRDAVKAATLAKIKSPTATPVLVNDWEHVTPVPASLTLTNQLNVDWWETDSSGESVKDKTSAANFLTIIAGRKLTTQPDRDDPTVVKNYLEAENVPTTPVTLPVAIPTSDEKFEKKPLTHRFNDVVCINTKTNCKSVPRDGNL